MINQACIKQHMLNPFTVDSSKMLHTATGQAATATIKKDLETVEQIGKPELQKCLNDHSKKFQKVKPGTHWTDGRPITGRSAGRRTKNEIGRASLEHRAVGRFGHFGTHRTGRPAGRCPPDATIFRTHTAGRFYHLSIINLNSN